MSRRAERKAKEHRRAITILSLAVAVIAMVGVAIFATREPQRDPVTGCPVGALPLAHTVIIVDQSDRYSPRQIYYAQSVILLEYDRLLPGERLTVVGLSPNPDLPQRILSKCRLRRGSDVVGFVTNPMMVEETFNRVVGHELSSFTRELATTETAPRSPIMETITAMLDSIDFSAGVPNRRLVLISDMAQFSDFPGSPRISHYPNSGHVEFGLRDDARHRFRRDMSGLVVRVHYLRRDSLAAIQTPEHEAFWRAYFADFGATNVQLGWGPNLVETRARPRGVGGVMQSLRDATDELLHGKSN